MAEGPFKAPSPKDKMDIFFDLYEEQQSQQVGARDPKKAWNQVVGALYLPAEYKWVEGNELDMEKKLTAYYQTISAKPIEDLLKQRQNIVSQYSTSTGGIVYVIKTSDGFRLITKYPDGTYTMSGTFLFLSAQDYANYYRAYKKWLDSGAKGPFTYDVYDGSQLPSPLSGVIQIPIGQGSRPDDLTITPTGGNDPDELGDLGGYTITIRRPIPKPIYMMYEKR